MLAVLTDQEKAAVLDELVTWDRRVRAAAEDAGRRRLARVDPRVVADTVTEALIGLDHEELATHAGLTRHGYVEPTEAAWLLLEREVEPWIDDIGRRAGLGLDDAARQLALGVLDGLHRLLEYTARDGLLLSWAPDFPSAAADRVLQALGDAGLELTADELGRAAPNWA
ncbi:MAG: hypothetical protein ACRDPC_11825 [Solirubrobacteraceae bacterium]